MCSQRDASFRVYKVTRLKKRVAFSERTRLSINLLESPRLQSVVCSQWSAVSGLQSGGDMIQTPGYMAATGCLPSAGSVRTGYLAVGFRGCLSTVCSFFTGDCCGVLW